MTKKSEGETPSERPSGLRFVEPRHWPEEDVAAAVEYLKQDIPDAWAELEELERTVGSVHGSEAVLLQFGALANLHPECPPHEISDLAWQVRIARRAALGLEI